MKYTITEQKALKKLGIPDFKHMTKDKIVEFTTMLPKMDPKVAMAALEQFPEFCSLGKEIVNQLVISSEKVLDSNNKSQDNLYNICNSIIDSLKKELESDNIDSDDRDRIENKMIAVAQLLAEKDSENKKWLAWLFGVLGFVGLATIGGGAAAIGVNSNMRKSGGSGRDDSDE